jgi:hypothetical protein
MTIKILGISNSMIGKPRLPDIVFPLKSPLRAEREAALDVLHCSFQTLLRRKDHMKMVRHDDIGMKQIGFASVVFENLLHE